MRELIKNIPFSTKSLMLFLVASWVICYAQMPASVQDKTTALKIEQDKKLLRTYIELADTGDVVFVPIAGVAQPAFLPVKKQHLEQGTILSNLLVDNALEDSQRKMPDILAYSNKVVLQLKTKLQELENQVTPTQ